MATQSENQIAVHVPRGPEAWWPTICKLDALGAPWAAAEVVNLTASDRRSVVDYVARLLAAGIIVRTAGAPTYRLARRPVEAPRLERDGTVSPPTGQQQMWNAIRALKAFNFVEVAHAASTDTRQISSSTAKAYVNALGRAGYLSVLHAGKPGVATLWRLKPSMNTGPIAPAIMRTKFVWDANRAQVVGAAEPAAEVQP
ncbi:hypothetical protein [Xanthobacter autotrophicus]|uniref:hypothetical protein n=1 Tax=Xanthobacter autotrophicus TaxID=280 RepID=UPI00372CD95E